MPSKSHDAPSLVHLLVTLDYLYRPPAPPPSKHTRDDSNDEHTPEIRLDADLNQ